MYRQPDSASVVRNGSIDALPDPPCGVRRELESALGIKHVNGVCETDHSFLHHVLGGKAVASRFHCELDHEADVHEDELIGGHLSVCDDPAKRTRRICRYVLVVKRLLGESAAVDPSSQLAFFACGEEAVAAGGRHEGVKRREVVAIAWATESGVAFVIVVGGFVLMRVVGHERRSV